MTRDQAVRFARALADEVAFTAEPVVVGRLRHVLEWADSPRAGGRVYQLRELGDCREWRELVWRAAEVAELAEEESA